MKIPSEYVQIEWNAREFAIYDSRDLSPARSTKLVRSNSAGACFTRWEFMTDQERICEIYVIFDTWFIARNSCVDVNRDPDIDRALLNLNMVEGISVEVSG